MKKVSEVAEILGVSRKTIYRKIDQLSLKEKGYVKTNNKVLTITNTGFEELKNSILDVTQDSDMSQSHSVTEESQTFETSVIKQYERLMAFQAETFNKTIETLKDNLLNKEKQIDDLKKDKDQLLKMQQNTQQLLIMEKQEKQALLELPQEPVRKSIWNIFKKSQPNPNWDNENS